MLCSILYIRFKYPQMSEYRTALIRVLPFLLITFVIFIMIKKKKVEPLDLNLNKPDSTLRFLLWTISFLVFILLTEFIFYKLGMLEVDKWDHPFGSSVIRIAGAVFLAPVVEELIFRGFILNVLRKKLNMHPAVFIQAVFFVLLHNFTYENTLTSNIGIVQSLIDAALYGYARYSTRSIYTPMAMHITGNFIATAERFIF